MGYTVVKYIVHSASSDSLARLYHIEKAVGCCSSRVQIPRRLGFVGNVGEEFVQFLLELWELNIGHIPELLRQAVEETGTMYTKASLTKRSHTSRG